MLMKRNNFDFQEILTLRKHSDVMIIVPAGNLYGRGASDNKAPVLAWIHAVEAYQALNMVRESAHTVSQRGRVMSYDNNIKTTRFNSNKLGC